MRGRGERGCILRVHPLGLRYAPLRRHRTRGTQRDQTLIKRAAIRDDAIRRIRNARAKFAGNWPIDPTPSRPFLFRSDHFSPPFARVHASYPVRPLSPNIFHPLSPLYPYLFLDFSLVFPLLHLSLSFLPFSVFYIFLIFLYILFIHLGAFLSFEILDIPVSLPFEYIQLSVRHELNV